MEGRLEQRIQFWAALGPFIVLLTLFVCFIKLSAQAYYLPLAALVGLPLCWKWRLKGVLVSLVVLTGLLAVSLPASAPGERMWFVGIGMALALGFAVTALSLEEMTSLIRPLLGPAAATASTDNAATERFVLLREQWRHDREDFQRKLSVLSRQVSEKDEEVARALAAAANYAGEINQLRSALADAQQQQHIVEASSKERQESSQVSSLKMELDQSSRQLEAMEMQLQELQEACQRLQKERQSATVHEAPIVEAVQEIIREAAEEAEKPAESDVDVPKAEVQVPVPVTADKALRASEGRYHQLRSQFDEKNRVLEDTRRHLFRLEGKVWGLQQKYSPAECPEDVRNLVRYIAYLEEEREGYHHDVEVLEDLLSEHLLQG